jgi:flagellar hook-length control protein FliK
MQTSQVNNPASMLTGAKQGGKQIDGGADGAFDQALSREVAERGDAARATEQSATPQPATAGGKSQDAKASEKTKSAEDGENTERAAAPADAQAQFSADMLALVAAINSITAPAANPATAAATDAGSELGLKPDTGRADPLAGLRSAVDADAQIKTEATSDVADKPVLDLKQIGAETAAALGDGAKAAREAAPEFVTAMQQSASNLAAAMPLNPQATLHAAQQAHALAGDKLTPSVGSPGWDQALGQKVVWMGAGDQQSASLTLNPPDLGPLQVVLNVTNSHANATFTAAQPEVRQALEAALPKLREMLGEAGIQLGQASVNSGAPNQHGGAERQAAQTGGRGFGGDGGNDGGGTQLRVSQVRPAAAGNGLVDTFA